MNSKDSKDVNNQKNLEKNENKKSDGKEIVKSVASWVLTLAVAYLLAWLVTNYVVINAVIPSESMENTVMTGDRLLANRLAYKDSDPERGDIIVFTYPVDKTTLYIKRIIGLPGEKVEITDGKIYINDSSIPLEEDYLPEEWTYENTGYVFNVPEDSYLVLGDNRNHSSDARFWKKAAMAYYPNITEEEAETYTFVSRDAIKGKAFFRYWPLTSIGKIGDE